MFNRIRRYFQGPQAKAIVLMYHRICDLETDPWQLAVSPDNFESHIKMLKETYDVLPLNELTQQIATGSLKNNSVYITFDDAYVDNYVFAKPILEEYACPATLFIPTHYPGSQQPFWWDELEAIILHSKELPSKLNISFDAEPSTFNVDAEVLSEEIKQKQQLWNWPEPPPTKRCELYLKIWEQLRPLPYPKISAIIDDIKVWANYERLDATDGIAMTTDQLKKLSENKLFSLGLHTQTHLALASHSKAIQNEEIFGCRNYLEENNYPFISAIAYPYGSYNQDTLSVIEHNQIALGFTTKAEVVTKSSSPDRLGRFQVNNYTGGELAANLNQWFKI
jgi:peptidoglycan/xylan/chitin deacetylase (PgdA/CDA1 family)